MCDLLLFRCFTVGFLLQNCVSSGASNFTLPNHPSLVPRPFIWMIQLKQVKGIFTEPIEMQFLFTLACLSHSWGILDNNVLNNIAICV